MWKTGHGIPILDLSAFLTLYIALTFLTLLSALQKQLQHLFRAFNASGHLCFLYLCRQDTALCCKAWSSDRHLAKRLLKEEELCLDPSGPGPKKATWQPLAAGNKSFPCCHSTRIVSVLSCSTHTLHSHRQLEAPRYNCPMCTSGCNVRLHAERESMLTSLSRAIRTAAHASLASPHLHCIWLAAPLLSMSPATNSSTSAMQSELLEKAQAAKIEAVQKVCFTVTYRCCSKQSLT